MTIRLVILPLQDVELQKARQQILSFLPNLQRKMQRTKVCANRQTQNLYLALNRPVPNHIGIGGRKIIIIR